MEDYLDMSEEVSAGLAAGKPVVALESTVIAHGLPHPSNVQTALAVESVIREAGAVPATIAVLGGRLRVGLSTDEIERLASGDDIRKLGTRDLPLALASGWDGATTVSATAFTAGRAGIDVMVTGGIGGVHADAGQTLDISSDLWEFTKSSIIVVCAGAKAILDLPATLEWLETHQVPVLGYQTAEFPAFYSRNSGLAMEEVRTPEEVARSLEAQRRLGLAGGIVVGVPPPGEPGFDVEQAISRALAEARKVRVRGKDLTPWLLARIADISGGASVEANVALLKNNARVGAEIAGAVADR